MQEDNKSELRYLYLAFSNDQYVTNASYSTAKDYKITYKNIEQKEFQISHPDIESEFKLLELAQVGGPGEIRTPDS